METATELANELLVLDIYSGHYKQRRIAYDSSLKWRYVNSYQRDSWAPREDFLIHASFANSGPVSDLEAWVPQPIT